MFLRRWESAKHVLEEIMPDAFAWTMIGILAAALIANVSRREHNRLVRFHDAAKAFRAALLPATTRLRAESANCHTILYEEFGKHREAALAFWPHLRGKHKRRFGKAWEAYEEYAVHQRQAEP